MKKLIIASSLLLTSFVVECKAQETPAAEKYGNTLNLGVGIGYHGYIGGSVPVAMVNYEFDIAKNFTIAPFIGVYSYQNYYYWGNPNKPSWDASYRRYSYRVVVVPVGAKATYYFDQLFRAGSKWDFYASGSVGFNFRTVTWEDDYYGDRSVYQKHSPLYLNAHVGAEYHLSQKAGLFLDLSTGISTFGLAIHF